MVHSRYPQVEMSEEEFAKLLDLVDALDHVQLLRLQCRVDALMRDSTPLRASALGPDVATLPPPPAFPDEDQTVEYDFDWGRKLDPK